MVDPGHGKGVWDVEQFWDPRGTGEKSMTEDESHDKLEQGRGS